MAKFTSRVDLFGTIIWTPPMTSARAADLCAALVESISIDNDCRSLHDLMMALKQYGAAMIINPRESGDTWTIAPEPGMWFAERMAEFSAPGRPAKNEAEKAVRINITLAPDDIAKLDALGGTRSGMIARLIREAG